jgi:predicted ATPase
MSKVDEEWEAERQRERDRVQERIADALEAIVQTLQKRDKQENWLVDAFFGKEPQTATTLCSCPKSSGPNPHPRGPGCMQSWST